jgi:hypothetical protein
VIIVVVVLVVTVVEQFEFWKLYQDRVLVMESVSEGERSWILKSLEAGVSSRNLDASQERKYNSATVPY